jgi:hypothetical protein
MFGFGFTKLAVLVGIVVAVWYGFKVVGQLDKARKQAQANKPPRQSGRGGGNDGGKAPEVEETVQCPICGAYVVAKSSSPCERPDCPY